MEVTTEENLNFTSTVESITYSLRGDKKWVTVKYLGEKKPVSINIDDEWTVLSEAKKSDFNAFAHGTIKAAENITNDKIDGDFYV